MYELNRELKNYQYINIQKVNNLYFQSLDSILKRLSYTLSLKFGKVDLSTNIDAKNKDTHAKIIAVYEYLKKKNYLFEPEDNLMYNEFYFTLEKLQLRKVIIDGSMIDSAFQTDKINIWISEDRRFSKYREKSPLILVSDNLHDKMSAMDGSSGYSIFKQLMENYLQCSDFSIKNINNDIKINFANDPVKYLKQLGCFISDKSDYEVLWEKRAILKDDSYNIVFTFAYPLFIAKQYTRRF